MNTIVQGAWSVVLSRYSGQEEVVYGATVSGRPGEMKGVERMVGVFINTLPVRVKVDSKQEVREWLKQMQSEQVEMRQYEYSGLMEVQGGSEMARGVAMFDSIFVFENYPVDKTLREQNGGLKIINSRSIERTHYPLALTVVPRKELDLQIRYGKSRFDTSTIKQILGHLEVVLEAIAGGGEGRAGELPLLRDEEL